MGNQNIRDEVNKILSSSTDTTVTVLSSLLLVQDEIGYIPNEAVEEIGSFLKTSINEVWGVAEKNGQGCALITVGGGSGFRLTPKHCLAPRLGRASASHRVIEHQPAA